MSTRKRARSIETTGARDEPSLQSESSRLPQEDENRGPSASEPLVEPGNKRARPESRSGKLRCYRIQDIPNGVTAEDLTKQLAKSPHYDKDCDILLVPSSRSRRSVATVKARLIYSEVKLLLPYHVDDDFIGITPIFAPVEASVDILFVPGLGGHAMGSFKGANSDRIWIRDFLPEDLPTARILTYGYNTSIQDSSSKYSVTDLAKGLLASLKAMRAATKTRQRPLIFVAHSLGGLLVKKALALALEHEQDSQERDIFKSSYALMFFGVPNLGLKNDALRTIVSGQPNEQLVHDLQVDDESEAKPFLNELKNEFVKCCKYQDPPFRVESYYELRKTSTVKRNLDGEIVEDGKSCFIVTMESACQIGYTDNFFHNQPLHVDHKDLVKFSSSSDDNYTKALSKLEDLIMDAPKLTKERFASVRELVAQERSHWRDLNDPPYDDFKKTEKVSTAEKGTLEWLVTSKANPSPSDHTLGNADFERWQNFEDSSTLLVVGSPGQGKSVLSNFVIDYLLQNRRSSRQKVIYYFCNIKNDERHRTASSIIRSLIVQLCEDRRLYERLPNRFREQRAEFFSASLEVLWSAFSDLLQTDLYDTIYCVIDGLDVYDNVIDELLKLLIQQVLTHRVRGMSLFKLICTSRPGGIEDPGTWGDLIRKRTLRASDDDLAIFIDRKLDSLPRSIGARVKATLRNVAMKEVGRTFLWISIMLREIAQRRYLTVKAVMDLVTEIPKDIDELYNGLVSKANDESPVNLAILLWITCAKHPLTLAQLEVAITVQMCDPSPNTWKDCEDQEITLDTEAIQVSMGSLVDVIDGGIFLIHQSLRDFLLKSQALRVANSGPLEMILATTCMRFLSFRDVNKSENSGDFAWYASSCWFAHIDSVDEARKCSEQLRSVFRSEQCKWTFHSSAIDYERYNKDSIWVFAITMNVKWLLDMLVQPNDLTAESGKPYIYFAMRQNFYAYTRLLDPNNRPQIEVTDDLVKEAVRFCWEPRMLQFLLDYRGDEVIVTPDIIQSVASCGLDTMQLLLKKARPKPLITEEHIMAVALNTPCSKDSLELLLACQGAEIRITEQVVKAAARNSSKEFLELLFQYRNEEVLITEEVVKTVAANAHCGGQLLELLFQYRNEEVLTTEEVVKTVAGNAHCGAQLLELLINRRGPGVIITKEVVKAAVGNRYSGRRVLDLLFLLRGEEVVFTEEILQTAARNVWTGRWMLLRFLKEKGTALGATEKEIKRLAARQEQAALLRYVERIFQVTLPVVKWHRFARFSSRGARLKQQFKGMDENQS